MQQRAKIAAVHTMARYALFEWANTILNSSSQQGPLCSEIFVLLSDNWLNSETDMI